MKYDKRIAAESLRATCRYCEQPLQYMDSLRAVGWVHMSGIAYTYCKSTFGQPHPVDQELTEQAAHRKMVRVESSES